MKGLIILTVLMLAVMTSKAQLYPQNRSNKKHPYLQGDLTLVAGAGLSLYVAGKAKNAGLNVPHYAGIGAYFLCITALFCTGEGRQHDQPKQITAAFGINQNGAGIRIRF